jgi:hypothetical protein
MPQRAIALTFHSHLRELISCRRSALARLRMPAVRSGELFRPCRVPTEQLEEGASRRNERMVRRGCRFIALTFHSHLRELISCRRSALARLRMPARDEAQTRRRRRPSGRASCSVPAGFRPSNLRRAQVGGTSGWILIFGNSSLVGAALSQGYECPPETRRRLVEAVLALQCLWLCSIVSRQRQVRSDRRWGGQGPWTRRSHLPQRAIALTFHSHLRELISCRRSALARLRMPARDEFRPSNLRRAQVGGTSGWFDAVVASGWISETVARHCSSSMESYKVSSVLSDASAGHRAHLSFSSSGRRWGGQGPWTRRSHLGRQCRSKAHGQRSRKIVLICKKMMSFPPKL